MTNTTTNGVGADSADSSPVTCSAIVTRLREMEKTQRALAKAFDDNKCEKDAETLETAAVRIGKLSGGLKECIDYLNAAFCHDSVNTKELYAEIESGRWNGVREVIERNSDLVS